MIKHYDMSCSDENLDPLIGALIRRTRESELVWKILHTHENPVYTSYTSEYTWKNMNWTLESYRDELKIIYYPKEWNDSQIEYSISSSEHPLVTKLQHTIFDKVNGNVSPEYRAGLYGIMEAMMENDKQYEEDARKLEQEYNVRYDSAHVTARRGLLR